MWEQCEPIDRPRLNDKTLSALHCTQLWWKRLRAAKALALQHQWCDDCNDFFTAYLQEQQDAIGLNLSSVYQQPPAPDPVEFLADQMVNATKAPEEYDPEELYDPSENM